MSLPPTTLPALRDRIAAGWEPEYVFFWGHTASSPNKLGKECLSQWYPSPFVTEGHEFPTAEHFMMWSKATLFGDHDTAPRILAARDPGAVKALGRTVQNFDEALWQQKRSSIVEAGSLAKFSQNTTLQRYLLGTGDRVLVEASPKDAVWGIGLAENHPDARHPDRWPGLNLLGFALMKARAAIRERAAG